MAKEHHSIRKAQKRRYRVNRATVTIASLGRLLIRLGWHPIRRFTYQLQFTPGRRLGKENLLTRKVWKPVMPSGETHVTPDQSTLHSKQMLRPPSTNPRHKSASAIYRILVIVTLSLC